MLIKTPECSCSEKATEFAYEEGERRKEASRMRMSISELLLLSDLISHDTQGQRKEKKPEQRSSVAVLPYQARKNRGRSHENQFSILLSFLRASSDKKEPPGHKEEKEREIKIWYDRARTKVKTACTEQNGRNGQISPFFTDRHEIIASEYDRFREVEKVLR